MFAHVIGAACTMTTKREAHWFEQTKAQNTEKGMYVGLKQPRGDGERYVAPPRAAAKETSYRGVCFDIFYCNSAGLSNVVRYNGVFVVAGFIIAGATVRGKC